VPPLPLTVVEASVTVPLMRVWSGSVALVLAFAQAAHRFREDAHLFGFQLAVLAGHDGGGDEIVFA